jgi:hypothetical protein
VGVGWGLRGLSGVPRGLEGQRLDGRGGRCVVGRMRCDGAGVESGREGLVVEPAEIDERGLRRDCWERGEPVVEVVELQEMDLQVWRNRMSELAVAWVWEERED